MIGRFGRSTLALALAVLTALAPAAPAWAQQQSGQTPPPAEAPPQVPARPMSALHPDFSMAKPWFPNIFAPYSPVAVPEPVLTNAPRIDQMIQQGQLRLSLQDAIDLALQNNVDIYISRYTPWLAEANLLRTTSGAGARIAVPNPGQTPQINFDPSITTTLGMDQRSFPVNNPLTAGTGTAANAAGSLGTHTAFANVAYTQGFHTGTFYSVAFNNTRLSTTSPAVFFNPSVTSNMSITVSQQLLNGFGLLANERNIRVARLNKNIADQTFLLQVITSVTAVSNAYWELVFARGNVDVNRQSVALAEKLYSDNQKQVEIGTLAPLEVIRAEAQLAAAQQGLISAQTVQLQNQITLMNLIARDSTARSLENVEIIPTEQVTPPELVESVPLEDALREAFRKRPDVLQSEETLKIDDINGRATRRALLPILTLSGTYASAGLAGNNRILSAPATLAGSQLVDANGSPILVVTSPGGTPVPVFVPTSRTTVLGTDTAGLGSAWNNVFSGAFPQYNAQMTLTIPIRNRQAQADNATALLTGRQNEARYRQVLNAAAADVHNTRVVLAQNRVAVEAATKARELQQETLNAEQRKLQLGASTIFQIVQDQRDLATTASQEVRALVDLAKAKIDFDRAMGRTLEVNNISISDAKTGQPSRQPLIPGTASTGQLFGDHTDDPDSVFAPAPAGSAERTRP